MNLPDIQDAIRAGHMLAGGHATTEAAADGLTLNDLWVSLISGTSAVIEDYPNDPRGPSCLLYCEVLGSAEHVVIAFPSAQAAKQHGYPSLVFLITCYRPGGQRYAAHWSLDFKSRVTP
jgi:hypothetical protein